MTKKGGFMTKIDNRPICVVHMLEDGWTEYLLNGEAVLLIVDERVPYDRVFRETTQTPREVIIELLGSSPIGSCHDSRHAAVAHRIRRAWQGERHLELVSDKPPIVAAVDAPSAAHGSAPPIIDGLSEQAEADRLLPEAAPDEVAIELLAHSPPECQRDLIVKLAAQLREALYRYREALGQIICEGSAGGNDDDQ
jgi:hypothetical protein